MATTRRHTGYRNALIGFTVLVLATLALLAGAVQWSNASWTPRLGLDLEGGTQMILEPRLTGSDQVTPEQIAQARDIIVQRVDANGVSGAEVTTQGGSNIVVSMPGIPDRQTKDAIQRSSQMQFRPVLAEGAGAPLPEPSAQPSGPGAGPSDPVASPAPSGASPAPAPTATPGTSPAPSPNATPSARALVPEALRSPAASSPTAPAASPTAPAASPSAPAASPSAPAASPSGQPRSATDLAWVTPEISAQFEALDCSKQDAVEGVDDERTKPLVTCSQDGQAKYILGPVVVGGDQIADASAGYQVLQGGQMSNVVEIQLSFRSEGTKAYADISREMVALQQPQNQLAATLDSRVIVAPAFREAIPNGQASITGGFTIEDARSLAQQLKFGALPISFTVQTEQDISPTLGSEQLRYGLIAGIFGLLLVVLYSLYQYRVLGFVTIASIIVAGILTYLAITILGWSHNYRLDMAGVTGLIVAIGFTADSFIVYFERIRDELREGRGLQSAVEMGWRRSRRTIVAADSINLIAAIVLYLLASSSVRGFAFTLGLTTAIDLLVTFLFSHPLVATLARRKFFSEGHPLSGLDPRKLGEPKTTRYAGRGRFTTAGGSGRSGATSTTARVPGGKAGA